MTAPIWRRLHRGVIRLHPPGFRHRFAQAVERTVADRMRACRSRSWWAAQREGWAVLLDLLAGLPGEWIREGTRHGRWGMGQTDAGRTRGLDGWWTDMRHAVRGLRRRPGLVGIAVLTLSVGVGANAAIFSVVHGVLLRPFDFPAADRVVVVRDRSVQGGAPFATTGGAYMDWRREGRTFESLALLGGYALNLTDEGLEPERTLGAMVSASYFDVVGIRPALGRTFTDEEQHGEPRVVILSDALWRGRYGADPAIVGRTIDADGVAMEVVGVLPPVALPMQWGALQMQAGGRERLVWLPVDLDGRWASGYDSRVFFALGRLADGATLETARADLGALGAGIRERNPESYTDIVPDARTLREALVGDVSRELWFLLGAVAMVLVVACANLTNLLLARAMDRDREMGIRAAVGAGRARLVRLALLEGMVLGAAGGAVALVAAAAGMELLVGLLPGDLPRRSEVGLSLPVVVFTALLSLVAGSLSAGLPAVRAARPRADGALRGGRGAVRSSGPRAVRGLVAGQLALACTLMVAAGLMARTFVELQGVDLGAETERTLVVELLLGDLDGDNERLAEQFRVIEERVAAAAGVESAALAYDTPVSQSWAESFTVADRPPPATGQTPGSWFRPVSPRYFAQHGISIRSGRGFTEADDADAEGVAVVNEAFVRRWFGGEEDRVLGRTLVCSCGGSAGRTWRIVGVVEDVRFGGLRAGLPPAAMYYSVRQTPNPFARLLVRTRGEPLAALPQVRAAVAEVVPRLPVAGARTLDRDRALMTARDRFNALLLGAFAVVALLVSAAGVYGVLAYSVARRTAEVGVRLALGAEPGRVRRLLLGEGLRMGAAGLLLGAGGAVLAGRLLSGTLFGVRPWDPWVLGGVVATLGLAVVLSGWVPARRAAGVDPSVALRGS